jgi:hypothetical protein
VIIQIEPRGRCATATAEMLELMIAEQFGRRADPGHPEESVRRRVVATSVPYPKHRHVCGRAD